MFKRLIVLLSTLTLITFSLLYQPNISKAEETNNPNNDFSKETYDQLIDEGVLNEDLSYEEWVKISDESLFDKMDESPYIEESDNSLKAASPTLKKGDILISNGTSSKGLTGHAAIAVGKSTVLHIVGVGKKPSTMNIKTWQKKYGIVKGQKDGKTKTKVYRPKSSAKAKKAANWAVKNYKGKNYKYGTGGKLTSKNPTYCSKIIWQAYNSANAVKKPKHVIVMPYDLPGLFKISLTKQGIL